MAKPRATDSRAACVFEPWLALRVANCSASCVVIQWASFLQENDKLAQVDFVPVESEPDTAAQDQIISGSFIEGFHEAPPGHGNASDRSASRSTFA